ncbi:hypothetical protein ACN2C7_15425 [Caulobacter sp. ErkDOM-E]
MPPQPSPRITPAQVLALIIIWGAVAYGLTVHDDSRQMARAEAVQLTACR